jgi:hypothetical protein
MRGSSTSFTSDSNAIATTSPLCRSCSEIGRAPNSIAKTAMAPATAIPTRAFRGSRRRSMCLHSRAASPDTSLICAISSGIAATSRPSRRDGADLRAAVAEREQVRERGELEAPADPPQRHQQQRREQEQHAHVPAK